MQDLAPLSNPVQVQVANGQVLSCTQFIHSTVWSVQGLQFKYDIKVLPLSSYDMILGLDWLESHSSMQVHWAHKWLKIPYEGTIVQRHGLLSSIPEGSIIQLCATDTSDAVPPDTWTPEIKQLLLDFDVLFQQPS